MHHTTTIPRYHHVERERGRHRQLVVGGILGLIIGVLAFAIVESTAGIVGAALSDRTATSEPAVAYPARELEPEWRWERKALDFDHMYRQKQAPQLDWIREGASTSRRRSSQ